MVGPSQPPLRVLGAHQCGPATLAHIPAGSRETHGSWSSTGHWRRRWRLSGGGGLWLWLWRRAWPALPATCAIRSTLPPWALNWALQVACSGSEGDGTAQAARGAPGHGRRIGVWTISHPAAAEPLGRAEGSAPALAEGRGCERGCAALTTCEAGWWGVTHCDVPPACPVGASSSLILAKAEQAKQPPEKFLACWPATHS